MVEDETDEEDALEEEYFTRKEVKDELDRIDREGKFVPLEDIPAGTPKTVEIEGEKAYPIYSVRIAYTYDINDENREYIHKNRILPDGRAKESLPYTIMYKEEQDIEFVKQEAKEKNWLNFIRVHERGVEKGRIPIDNPQLESIEVSLLRYETWCPTWFSHWTFDDGRSDEEYLRSFGDFVNRMERVDDYCLMGAEDRWRWHGVADDGETTDPNKYTKPPCRCKHCKAKGIVRIDH